MPAPQSQNPDESALIVALRSCRAHIRDAAVFSALLNLLYLAPTLYMLQVYDRAVPARSVPTLAMLTAMFLLAAATIGVLDLVRTRLLVRAAVRLDRRLAGPILGALLRVERTAGKRTTTALRDFDSFRQTVTGAGVLALFDAPWCPLYVLVCFVIHPAIGALALVGGAMLLGLSLLNERATGKALVDAGEALSRSYAGIEEMLAGAEAARGLGMREALVARALRERHEGGDLQVLASFRSGGFTSATKTVRFILQSLGLGLGAWLAVRGSISAGSIFAASLLISRALQPIELVTGAWRNIVHARSTYGTLHRLFEQAGAVIEPTALPAPEGRLEIAGISVAGSHGRPLLEAVTFFAEPGEAIGIVGHSGAGKSTLVRALVGAVPLAGGTIRLDGASIKDWPARQLGRAIGYVPQASTLFRGTVKENIARFDTELVARGSLDAAVIEAAERAGAHDFILRLPQGYDTRIGPGAVMLSAGQAQRIALARALYGDPCLVVLDEANAGLDQEGEERLHQAVIDLRRRGVTTVIVAHQSSLLNIVDKLLVMKDGRIERTGTRAPQPAAAVAA